jgi:nucleolar protein 16
MYVSYQNNVDIPAAALCLLTAGESAEWDDKGSVIHN